MYYLQSRYYNAEWGRFVNADDANILKVTQKELTGSNLFSYCANNAVNNIDPSGFWYRWYERWNSVYNMGVSIDFIIQVSGYILGIYGAVSSIRYIISHNAKGLVLYATKTLLRKIGISLAGSIIEAMWGIFKTVTGFSLGQAIAYAWDRLDRYPRDGICEFDFRWW